MERFRVATTSRQQFVDITARVREVLRSGHRSAVGAVLVYCPHTTAGITINENADPDVATDLLAWLTRAVPCEGDWRHCEGNSDAHMKASLVGSSALVPVEDGELVLGRWQGIYLAEFDGPRNREVFVRTLAG